jgi:hypothetical protein
MPTSKSSTSSEPDYKKMLDELLAVVHRDGGQYTILAGYDVSSSDACRMVAELYRRYRSLAARVDQYARGEL